jgi:hypothetical protein
MSRERVSHQSPVVSHQSGVASRQSQSSDAAGGSADGRESVTHGRASHIVNKRAEDDARRDDAELDPVMPTGDSTLKTDI